MSNTPGLINQLRMRLFRSWWTLKAWAMARATQLFIKRPPRTENEEARIRRPLDEDELHYWLRSMLTWHRFSVEEAASATGLSRSQVKHAAAKIAADPGRGSVQSKNLTLLPYPGGRHPRRGFRAGAIDPQRETKASIFTPWDPTSYLVVDVPEALWANRKLIYLAHSHVDTVWTRQGVQLEKLEWNRDQTELLEIERTLPNGIKFGTRVEYRNHSVCFDQWLTNQTKETLTGLRMQNCILFQAVEHFNQQTNRNKYFWGNTITCRSNRGDRWIIATWSPKAQIWANPYCPCMHCDPIFDDCPPGQTRSVKGRISFYQGRDIEGEVGRIATSGSNCLGTKHFNLNHPPS